MAHLFRPTKAIGTLIKITIEWSHLDRDILHTVLKDTMCYQIPLLYGVVVMIDHILQLHTITLTIGLILLRMKGVIGLLLKVEITLHTDITHRRLGCIPMVDICTLHMDHLVMRSNHLMFQLVGPNSTSRLDIVPIRAIKHMVVVLPVMNRAVAGPHRQTRAVAEDMVALNNLATNSQRWIEEEVEGHRHRAVISDRGIVSCWKSSSGGQSLKCCIIASFQSNNQYNVLSTLFVMFFFSFIFLVDLV